MRRGSSRRWTWLSGGPSLRRIGCRSLDPLAERKSRNLRHAEDELHDSLKLQADETPPVTGQASYATPTVSSQHTNATASHSDAAATMNNESLHLLLSQYSLQTCCTQIPVTGHRCYSQSTGFPGTTRASYFWNNSDPYLSTSSQPEHISSAAVYS